jgi:galacturan 1,4-alpha-galacturonidase
MTSYSIFRLLYLSIISQAAAHHISVAEQNGRTTCTVFPGRDNATDDVPTILKAFDQCGHGGNIVFPQNETYHINSRLNPQVNDVNIDWQGKWVVSPASNFSLTRAARLTSTNMSAIKVL